MFDKGKTIRTFLWKNGKISKFFYTRRFNNEWKIRIDFDYCQGMILFFIKFNKIDRKQIYIKDIFIIVCMVIFIPVNSFRKFIDTNVSRINCKFFSLVHLDESAPIIYPKSISAIFSAISVTESVPLPNFTHGRNIYIYMCITRRSSGKRTKGRKRLLVRITYLAFYLSIDPVHRQGSVYRRIRKIYITFKNTSPPPGVWRKRKIFRIESLTTLESRLDEKFWNFEIFFLSHSSFLIFGKINAWSKLFVN